MPLFFVKHVTRYQYARPVAFGEHRIMFRPRDSFDQRLIAATLSVEPEPSQMRWIHDVFGNCVALVTFERPSTDLVFETYIELDHTPLAPLDFEIDDEARSYPFRYPPDEMADLKSTIRRHHKDPDGEVARWAAQFVRPAGPTETGRLLMTMCYAIRESFAYARRQERGTQTPLQTLALRRGTCRDFALLMMEGARALGFAARFVSGYVYVPDRDGSFTRGGGSTHAWCQIYLPGAGWVEFDPTNGIVGSSDLIRVAVARDPRQAIPLIGSYDGTSADFKDMSVQVNVTTHRSEDDKNKQEEASREPPPAAGVQR